MFVQLSLLITTVKFFFLPLYHSTDFEVHRNWLAITHNLPTEHWYYEKTSEWTLDYPPLFAWMEYALSLIAPYFDHRMLYISNLNYSSEMTVFFQRLSVIVLDIVYIAGAKSCCNLIPNANLLVFILLVSNPGLLMVDHIHFQYNGVLYGILLFSISFMTKSKYLEAAFCFAVLLNMKHIYLYIAPVYIVYLFRAYCFTVPAKNGKYTDWDSFSLTNFIKLAAVVLFVFGVSFWPFQEHIPQIISRLFPFKRGLTHAYWAPNFWALYNFADKVLQTLFAKLGFKVSKVEATMTGGLVQEYTHSVLPNVTPTFTFILTFASMLPALVKLWNLCADRYYRGVNFMRCLVICATCSFMFSWHVHEKAVLMIIIPFSILAVLGEDDGRLFMLISNVGHYSLFPLIHPKNLLGLKIMMLLNHSVIAITKIPLLYENDNKHKKRRRGFLKLPLLGHLESLYLYGFIPLCIYANALQPLLGLDKKLPFLPLMLTSVYCALGMLYFWITYYYYFMTFGISTASQVTETVDDDKKSK